MQKFSNSAKNLITTLAVLTAFFLGIYVDAHNLPAIEKVLLANKETAVATEADFSPFWKVWNAINEKYPQDPGSEKVTDQEKVYGAISGLVGSLDDPYSVFFNPKDAQAFEEEIAGNFTGIGMEVGIKDRVLTVIAPLKDTPAYRANIKPGDKILKIDQTITADLSIEKAIKLIRGEKGTTVTLTIFREGESEPREIKIVRDIINIPTLDTELRADGIFVIKLYSFSATSSNLFRQAIKKFAESRTDKLLLDLRGNPGGYLDAAVNIASWFLPSGKVIVTEDYGNDKEPEIFRSRGYSVRRQGYNVLGDDLKFVILIDNGSASASEIVAGALQDHGRAKLVGAQSFGKGSVQQAIKITPETLLKITVAKWLTPNGNLIEEKGLTPDYKVEITKKDLADKKPARTTGVVQSGGDPQLQKAVEILLK